MARERREGDEEVKKEERGKGEAKRKRMLKKKDTKK